MSCLSAVCTSGQELNINKDNVDTMSNDYTISDGDENDDAIATNIFSTTSVSSEEYSVSITPSNQNEKQVVMGVTASTQNVENVTITLRFSDGSTPTTYVSQ